MKVFSLRQLGLILGFLVLAAPALYAVSYGEEGDFRRKAFHEEREKRMNQILTEVGVTNPQLKQIETHRRTHRQEKVELFQKISQKRKALGVALDAPQTDRKEVHRLVDEMSALKSQQSRHHVDAVLTLKEILTPQQFARLRAKREEVHQKLKDRRGETPRWRH